LRRALRPPVRSARPLTEGAPARTLRDAGITAEISVVRIRDAANRNEAFTSLFEGTVRQSWVSRSRLCEIGSSAQFQSLQCTFTLLALIFCEHNIMSVYETNAPERASPQTTRISASDDVRTIMLNEISWGAVIAGAIIGLVVQLILNVVGIGIGLSTVNAVAGDSPSASSLSIGAGIWWVISGIIAAGIGGYLAGRLSGKPSQSTTAYHGLISWAVSVLVVAYLVSSAASGVVGGAFSGATTMLGGAGKAVGSSAQTAVQTAAPSLNNISDPMSRIEEQVRSASGGQDPAALRDAATTSIRAALSGDPGQQAAATDKAAAALAKAQNIPGDQAKAQIGQYQQQYKEMVAKAKEQAKEAADAAARTVSRGALFGALALLLGALAAFFAGQAAAVVPTVDEYSGRPR